MWDLRFDVSLHPLPGGLISGPPLVDPRGTWPTIVPPIDAAGMTMTSDFDAALERLGALERAFVEPDGSFVWVGPGGEDRWQIDGNAYERHDGKYDSRNASYFQAGYEAGWEGK